MRFEELTEATRAAMRQAFQSEESSGNPYRSVILSPEGLARFPILMLDAIDTGNEDSLALALSDAVFWLGADRRGNTVTPEAAAARLALTEFNTWYVAGLAQRLRAEGETECEVYRAEDPIGERSTCSTHEERRYPLDVVIAGHRASYWPPPGLRGAFTIPAGPSCHHTIRRCPY